MVQIYIEDEHSNFVHQRSGADMVSLNFENSPKRFLQREYDNVDSRQDVLSVDLANFSDPKDYDAFTRDVSEIDKTIVLEDRIQRHSLGPEPLLQFVLSDPGLIATLATGYWVVRRVEKFVSYTVDETLRKLGDGISDSLSGKINEIVKTYRKHRPMDDRPITTKIVVPTNVELILLIKTQADKEMPAIDFCGLVAEMEKYGDILEKASSATFSRIGNSGWTFEYCTTRSGKVIGSLECYKRTEINRERSGLGISIGGYAAYDRPDHESLCVDEEQKSSPSDAGATD